MTTYGELKTAVARSLQDADAQTFSTTDLGDFVNEAIAKVSAFAPQRFTEDVTLLDGMLLYRLRGGDANLIANPSFEEGDATIVGETYIPVTTATAPDLLAGWSLSANTNIGEPQSAFRKTGSHVLRMHVASTDGSNVTLRQDVPVNAETVYAFGAWHWKGVTGGQASRVAVKTLDASSVVVDTVYTHDTTASAPVYASGVTTIPASGVSYLRLELTVVGTVAGSAEDFYFEDALLVEQSDQNLVAVNAVPEIEVVRCELWDNSETPERFLSLLQPAASQFVQSSGGGWYVWGGYLSLSNVLLDTVDVTTQFVRVFGYAPYDRLTTDSQVTDITDELEWAVREWARIAGLRRLVSQRVLFTQWQTRSGNTDITPASLLSDLNMAEDSWRRSKRELTVLRSAV